MALLSLTSCGKSKHESEIRIFAAASMTETLDQLIEDYKTVSPDVTILPTYDSSGTLLTQIQEGANCDLFISAASKQMNVLDGNSFLMENTRLDLLENQVILAVPAGNPKGIKSFDLPLLYFDVYFLFGVNESSKYNR